MDGTIIGLVAPFTPFTTTRYKQCCHGIYTTAVFYAVFRVYNGLYNAKEKKNLHGSKTLLLLQNLIKLRNVNNISTLSIKNNHEASH